MTIDQIRKKVMVKDWWVDRDGLVVEYDWCDETNSIFILRYLRMNSNEAHTELIELGEADPDNSDWDWVMENYEFSQWDAINWVVKHEYQKSITEDTKSIDIGKSIEDMF